MENNITITFETEIACEEVYTENGMIDINQNTDDCEPFEI